MRLVVPSGLLRSMAFIRPVAVACLGPHALRAPGRGVKGEIWGTRKSCAELARQAVQPILESWRSPGIAGASRTLEDLAWTTPSRPCEESKLSASTCARRLTGLFWFKYSEGSILLRAAPPASLKRPRQCPPKDLLTPSSERRYSSCLGSSMDPARRSREGGHDAARVGGSSGP
jgi:hypothetical protein